MTISISSYDKIHMELLKYKNSLNDLQEAYKLHIENCEEKTREARRYKAISSYKIAAIQFLCGMVFGFGVTNLWNILK